MTICFTGDTMASRMSNLQSTLERMRNEKVDFWKDLEPIYGSGSIVTAQWWVENRISEYREYHPDLTDKEIVKLCIMQETMGTVPEGLNDPFIMEDIDMTNIDTTLKLGDYNGK